MRRSVARGKTEALYRELTDPSRHEWTRAAWHERLLAVMAAYQAALRTVQSLATAGCYRSELKHDHLWTYCLERVANRSFENGRPIALGAGFLYPAMVLMYSGGLVALAVRNATSLSALLLKTNIVLYHERRIAAYALSTFRVIPGVEMYRISNGKFYTRVSEHLHKILRSALSDYLPSDLDYDSEAGVLIVVQSCNPTPF